MLGAASDHLNRCILADGACRYGQAAPDDLDSAAIAILMNTFSYNFLERRQQCFLLAALVSAICCGISHRAPAAEAEMTNSPLTITERLEPARLKAVHAARSSIAQQRQATPEHGLYDDLPGIILHPGLAGQPKDAQEQWLAAAKKAGIKVLIVVYQGDPGPNAWRGMHEDVLFIPASEAAPGTWRLPEFDSNGKASPSAGLSFFSGDPGQPETMTEGIVGMEIQRWKPNANFDQTVRAKLLAEVAQFPDEVAALENDSSPESLAMWDKQAKAKHVAGLGATELPTANARKLGTTPNLEVLFRNLVTHFLVRGQTEALLREAITNGHVYVSHDWLADPAGYSFAAINNSGVYGMGDGAPLAGKTRVMAITPVPAHLKLVLNGEVVSEATGTNITYEARVPGPCRLEAWLNIDGDERPWIFSNPIYLRAPKATDSPFPRSEVSADVETHKDISYLSGTNQETSKHMLDVYAPKEKRAVPVMFFIHGGAWKSGDRTLYPPLGLRYARAGILTVIPSYRLAPRFPHPAQIDDVAAAFAWTVEHAAEFGGDTNRIFVAGHSAGGHLAALLALDASRLAPFHLSPQSIKGVMAWSGVYNLNVTEGLESIFGSDAEIRRQASPLHHVKSGGPRFMVSYCQFDYFSLPFQARQFYRALRKADVDAELFYIPDENHLSEVMLVTKPDDPLVNEALRFMQK